MPAQGSFTGHLATDLQTAHQSRHTLTVYRETGGSILAMQPLATICIRRPFHWGIVIIADAEFGSQIPDVDPERAVSSNEHGVIALIRHAQDIDSFEGEFDWAEAQVLVRLLTQAEPPSTERREVFRGRLMIANGRISIGDADGDVVHPAHEGWNELIVTVASDVAVSDLSPEELRVDLIPAV